MHYNAYFRLFGHQEILFDFMKTFSENVAEKKLCLLTMAVEGVGSGFE
jgi:hypothetical protein